MALAEHETAAAAECYDRLGMAVDMHVRNVLTKLGCHSRTEAARRAAELGLVELTRPAAS